MNALIREPDFQARIGKITASRIGAVLGCSPFAKPEDIMREMVREHFGAEREFQGNQFTRWGQEHEADAIKALEIEKGILVTEGEFTQHPTEEDLACTPDGRGSDGSNVECKCPQKIKPLGELGHYWHQCQLQMACTGTKFTWFVQWTPDEVSIERIDKDPMWKLAASMKTKPFMAKYREIIADPELAAPYLEPLVVEHDEPEWQSKAAELSHINAELKNLQAREKELKAQLIELADGKKSTGCGVTVYPTTRKSVDYKRLLGEKHISTDGYEKESISWTVRVQ